MKTFVIFLALGSSILYGASSKPPAVSAFGNVTSSMRSYKTAHEGKLPEDWEEFERSGSLSSATLEEARKYCDIEHRYQFLIPAVPIEALGNKERVVFMAVASGGEGDKTEQNREGESIPSPGRYLIVETEGGNLESRRYSEKALQHYFEGAGLDLASYTSTSAPSPRPAPRDEEPAGVVLGEAGLSVVPSGEEHGPLPSVSHDRNGTLERPHQEPHVIWLVAAGAVLLIIAAAAIVFRGSGSKSRPSRNIR